MIHYVRVATDAGVVEVAVDHSLGQYRVGATVELVRSVGTSELADVIARALQAAATHDAAPIDHRSPEGERVWPRDASATNEIPRVRRMPYSPEVQA